MSGDYEVMNNMMGNMMGGGWISLWSWGLGYILGPLTWLALLIFLVLGSIYFWEGLKKRKGEKS